MASSRDIVVTGVGVVSPIGIGKEPFWAALCAGRSGIRRLPGFDDPSLSPPFGGQVADFDPKQYVRPRKSLKVMSRDIQLGFAAADMACVDAGLRETPPDPERLGVMLGADMIPCDLDELIGTYRSCTVDGRFDFHRWGQAFPKELYPLWMLKYLPNMPACHIGIAQDARGPNNTVTLGDVSTLSALCEAVRVLERGQADMIIAGGASARTQPALWVRNEVLGQSRHADDPAAASRPFDSRRDGLVHGEGSGTLILETQSHARARGAHILARILGYAAAFEPRRHGQPCQGTALRWAIVAALRAAGLEPAQVGCVVAHGGAGHSRYAGRRAGDGAEELFRLSWRRGRRAGGGTLRADVCARAGAAHAQLRASRSAMSDQRDSRPATAGWPPGGLDPQPFTQRPGGGDRVGRAAVAARDAA
jgi:3-oxoacyl-[acyl-carrier-protein] synthase II